VPHERLGEVGYAFVQPTDATTPSADDLLAACKKTLADYKVPRYVEFVDTFPMTSTGKLERHRLAAQATESVIRPA
jgi:fatty-acyl-CoA synthase